MSEVLQLVDRPATAEEAKKLGLLDGEFELIESKLGREPTFTELAMFSGMWSEHCSYKNSILLLKELFSESDRLLAEAGEENAGALRINDRQAVVFKIESHNHPSALEPYQGAATGVGGIMRDIFTMGARPLVSLNSLRFGMPDSARNRYLLRQVVKGIGDYGNSLGIACAGGEVFFHSSYSKNPLVNAMVIGIADIDKMASARASGPGNVVMYVGAKTGRDGIHGASFASKDLSAESEEERSAVQVGDPFMEKLVMEATLTCIEQKLVVAIQDMGAAGLVSSSSEMSSSGEVGMNLHLDRVPAREQGMLPFEFLLSESQERMLMVVEPSKIEKVKAVYKKWNLDAVEIGEVTDSKKLRIFFNGDLYADIPAHALAVHKEGAPRYRRESKRPAYLDDLKAEKVEIIHIEKALQEENINRVEEIICKVISSVNLASKKAVYEQYDTDIGVNRLIGPGLNAGVYRVPGSEQAIACSTDGNGYYIALDPWLGSQHNVAEAYRNLVSAGASPIGITNCLNFANPYKPENFYFFEQAVKAMSAAAEYFEIPITGGNVSLYNESEDGPVLPTPTLGMVGLVEQAEKTVDCIARTGYHLYLVGDHRPQLEASLYQHILEGKSSGALSPLNLETEKKVARALLAFFEKENKRACIDLSFGGMLTGLLRMLFAALDNGAVEIGFRFEKAALEHSDVNWFGESAHSYLLAVENADDIKQVEDMGVQTRLLGIFNNSKSLHIGIQGQLPVLALYQAYSQGLSQYL